MELLLIGTVKEVLDDTENKSHVWIKVQHTVSKKIEKVKLAGEYHEELSKAIKKTIVIFFTHHTFYIRGENTIHSILAPRTKQPFMIIDNFPLDNIYISDDE